MLEEIPARERRRWAPLWQGLLEATGHSTQRISARERPEAALAGDLTWRMTLDAHHPSSIYSSVDSAISSTREKLRNYVSPEAWGVLHHLFLRLEAFRRHGERVKSSAHAKSQTTLAVDTVLTDMNAFFSTAERTMLHDAAWHFLRMGIHLERATMTRSALRHVLSENGPAAKSGNGNGLHVVRHGEDGRAGAERGQPGSCRLCCACAGLVQDAYRRLFQTRSQPRHVADFFLRQPNAPRSIFYNLTQIDVALRALDPAPGCPCRLEAAMAGPLRRLQARSTRCAISARSRRRFARWANFFPRCSTTSAHFTHC